MSTVEEVFKHATFSPCRKYRYTLLRSWNGDLGQVAFIGLNPSTADENIDDPTIRRCIGFSKAWGFGSLMMLNLFAYRSTNPKGLLSVVDPVGECNDEAIASEASGADLVICAWGTHGKLLSRDKAVVRIIELRKPLLCLGVTQCGRPKHPLYLSSKSTPIPFKEQSK